MNSAFLVWCPGSYADGVCVLKGTKNIERAYQLKVGKSRLEGWPSDACSHMNKSFPKDIGLADSLIGTMHVVVSGRVKSFLDGEKVEPVEFLPLQIINHKGRVASKDHYILNPLRSIDCIDMAASQARVDALDPANMDGVSQLVLREDNIPADAMVFRTLYLPGTILVRRGLADKLRATDLTGLKFVEPHEYEG